jgi:hypothetical protein
MSFPMFSVVRLSAELTVLFDTFSNVTCVSDVAHFGWLDLESLVNSVLRNLFILYCEISGGSIEDIYIMVKGSKVKVI